LLFITKWKSSKKSCGDIREEFVEPNQRINLKGKSNRRKLNEAKFPNWIDLSDSGRKYWYDVEGKFGFRARYIKEVDKEEKTTKFYQQIYDKDNNLVEIHEKFPEDRGHKKLRR
jgi:hypothetical protein